MRLPRAEADTGWIPLDISFQGIRQSKEWKRAAETSSSKSKVRRREYKKPVLRRRQCLANTKSEPLRKLSEGKVRR
jgi:hypothetical protein